MKTKIRSLIIICTLGLVGVLNANATLSYKTSCVAGTLQEQNNAKSENLNSTGFVFNEDADAAIDYQIEAQLVSKLIADNEEAKTIQMLIDRGILVSNDETDSFVGEANLENLNSVEFDYQMEAQLITKLIADNEEAKTIQKLIDEGKLVENK
jgi:alpha-D-ribose 1-methylphosphonate 5-triphosphate synthase subunit PhnI